MGGTYTLILELAEPSTIGFGALGERSLDSGWYAYVGSALGPGGFARVDRHRRVADGGNDTRHWHVDYLLGHPASRLERAVRSPEVDAECGIARAIDAGPISGVGASDCDCRTHLFYRPTRAVLATAVSDAHDVHS